MDRRIHFSWSKYLQKGKPQLPFDVPDSNSLLQMWVSAEEYQEDPDIIHKKSGF